MPALDWERPHAKSGGMALNFIWLDWAMIVAFLLLTTGIAFMTRRLISNYDSFLLAGRLRLCRKNRLHNKRPARPAHAYDRRVFRPALQPQHADRRGDHYVCGRLDEHGSLPSAGR